RPGARRLRGLRPRARLALRARRRAQGSRLRQVPRDRRARRPRRRALPAARDPLRRLPRQQRRGAPAEEEMSMRALLLSALLAALAPVPLLAQDDDARSVQSLDVRVATAERGWA